ncbi:MAG: GNAT family N-acetyltransferase [Cyanobacteria bacterium P01_A01_bin.17]
MEIRKYIPTDWPRLCKIHDAARLDELRLSVGEAAFLTLEQTAKNEGLFDSSVVVAEASGCVEGFAAFSQDELTWLYVNPLVYRRGIGRGLLRYAIEHAGDRFAVEVLEGNEPALKLYLSEGFSITKKSNGRLAGNEAFEASGYRLERRKTELDC